MYASLVSYVTKHVGTMNRGWDGVRSKLSLSPCVHNAYVSSHRPKSHRQRPEKRRIIASDEEERERHITELSKLIDWLTDRQTEQQAE